MGRVVTIVLVLAALAVPAALADNQPATQSQTNAAQQCKAQLKNMGAKDFRSLWGTNKNGRNAFGQCVALTAQQNQKNVQSAEEQCRTDRAKDPEAFTKKWGTNKNGRNAFGKCVSQTAQAESQQQQQATLNAAQTCKAERAKDLAAFRSKYGTNHNKRNAFARCVALNKKK
jgi:hypothetical protein